MPDALAAARDLIQSRLAELDAEAKDLESALRSLGEGGSTKRLGAAERKPGPRRKATDRRKSQGRPKRKGNRAPRGQRREQVVAAIGKTPGAKATDVGKEIGISANQAYTLAGRLQKQDAIRKRGKGYALKP